MTAYTTPPQPPTVAGTVTYDSYRNWVYDASALTVGYGYVVFLPNGPVYRPTTIALSNPAQTSIDVCGDPISVITGGSPNWIPVTPSSVTVLDYTLIAVRIGNAGTSVSAESHAVATLKVTLTNTPVVSISTIYDTTT